jgi:uncharacterized membrane protein YdjX (TVP38/TMEM64 family)
MLRLLRQFTVLVLLIVAARYAVTAGYVSETGVRQVVERAGPLAVPTFILATVVTCLTLVPLALPVGAGAILFGATSGAIYAWFGAVLGACAAFAIGRHVAPDFTRRRGQGRLIGRVREWIEARLATHALGFMVAVKFSFFANSALSYAAGVTSVRFRDYALGTLIGCLPGVLVLSHACEAVLRAESAVDLLTHPAVIGLAVLRLAGLTLVLLLVRPGARARIPGQAVSEQTGRTGR